MWYVRPDIVLNHCGCREQLRRGSHNDSTNSFVSSAGAERPTWLYTAYLTDDDTPSVWRVGMPCRVMALWQINGDGSLLTLDISHCDYASWLRYRVPEERRRIERWHEISWRGLYIWLSWAGFVLKSVGGVWPIAPHIPMLLSGMMAVHTLGWEVFINCYHVSSFGVFVFGRRKFTRSGLGSDVMNLRLQHFEFTYAVLYLFGTRSKR